MRDPNSDRIICTLAFNRMGRKWASLLIPSIHSHSNLPVGLFTLDNAPVSGIGEDHLFLLRKEEIDNLLTVKVRFGVSDSMKSKMFREVEKAGFRALFYLDADCFVAGPLDGVWNVPVDIAMLRMGEHRHQAYRACGLRNVRGLYNAGVILFRRSFEKEWSSAYRRLMDWTIQRRSRCHVVGETVWNVVYHRIPQRDRGTLPKDLNYIVKNVGNDFPGSSVRHFAGTHPCHKLPKMRKHIRWEEDRLQRERRLTGSPCYV